MSLSQFDPVQNDLQIIKESLKILHDKIDAIEQGPIFRRTLSITDSLDEKVAKNLKSLNDMILQMKGMMAQMSTIRGTKKSDWYGEELEEKRALIKSKNDLQNESGCCLYPKGKECPTLANSIPLEIQ